MRYDNVIPRVQYVNPVTMLTPGPKRMAQLTSYLNRKNGEDLTF